MLPFHLDTRKTSAQRIPSTSHAWAVQHEAWNGGAMDRWLPAHRKADGVNGPYVMGYHTRNDIPFQFALAEAFTVCDAYHCSVLGPTFPNRMYWMTGTIDPEGTGGGPIISNTVPRGGYKWITYPERLDKAGVSWKVYQEKDNYECNMLENFSVSRMRRPVLRFTRGEWRVVVPENLSSTPSTITCRRFPGSSPPAINRSIRTSCRLPARPFVASKIDAIAANPEVWAKTVFILNYDENDGIFDHVAPPTPPRGHTPGICTGAAHRRGFPRALHSCFALDCRRLGVERTLRPHIGREIS